MIARFVVLFALGCAREGAKDQGPDVGPEDDTDEDDTDAAPPIDDADGDGVADADDCDPLDPDRYPGAPDVCGDDRVTDCDRTSDDGLVSVIGGATFTDLQQALDAATGGAEIVVCPGSYTGAFVAAAPVALRSHAGATVTTLDGWGVGRVLSVPAGSTVTGFTIRRGIAFGSGGGVLLTSPGALGVHACVVIENRAVFGGGIAIPNDSVLTVSETTVEQNTAEYGGGGISASDGSTVDLTTSVVWSNFSSEHGGGVYLGGAALIGGEVSENVADGLWPPGVSVAGGGGVSTVGTAAISGTVIVDNEALYGGGLAVGTGSVVATDVLVHGNDGRDGYGGGAVAAGDLVLAGTTEIFENTAGFGAGLHVSMDATVTGGLVRANAATDSGGGIHFMWGRLVDVTVRDNTAANAGGGIWMDNGGAPTLSLSGGVVSGNSAAIGGGVGAQFCPDLPIEGMEISGNVATEAGGGLYTLGTTLLVTGGRVVGNSAPLGGGAVVEGTGTIVSDACDWGVDPDDNLPDDVIAGPSVTGWDYDGDVPVVVPPPVSASGYGADATFTCTEDGCLPAP